MKVFGTLYPLVKMSLASVRRVPITASTIAFISFNQPELHPSPHIAIPLSLGIDFILKFFYKQTKNDQNARMRELFDNLQFQANNELIEKRIEAKLETILDDECLDEVKDKLKDFNKSHKYLKKLDFLIQQNLHSSPLELISDSGNLQLALRRLIDKSVNPFYIKAKEFHKEFSVGRSENDPDWIELDILVKQLRDNLLTLHALNKAVEESSWQSYIDHIEQNANNDFYSLNEEQS